MYTKKFSTYTYKFKQHIYVFLNRIKNNYTNRPNSLK